MSIERVKKDTKLRIRPGEKTPDPGDDNPVRVPQREWDAHNRRIDTATAHATEEPDGGVQRAPLRGTSEEGHRTSRNRVPKGQQDALE